MLCDSDSQYSFRDRSHGKSLKDLSYSNNNNNSSSSDTETGEEG